MAQISPTRYSFLNEDVLVDPRSNGVGVVATIPRNPTTPKPVSRYITPTVPTPAPAVPPSPTTTQTGLQTMEEFFASRTGNVDEASIREQTRRNMQAQIDATNSYYDDLIRRENQAGEARNDKVRAINVNAGLSGSNFATSADLTQKDKNAGVVRGIESQRNLETAAIFGRIDELARAEIKAKKEEALGNAEAYAAYREKAQTQAREDLQTMAKSGVDISSLDPQRKQFLFQAAGYDEQFGELLYDAQKPKATQVDWKFEKLADGKGMFWGVDPTTGQPKRVEVNVEVPDGFTMTIAPDGTPLIFNKTTGEAQIASGFGQGQFEKSTSSPTDLLATEKDRAAFNQIVNNYNKSPLIAASDRTIILKKTVDAVKANPDDAALQLNLAYGYIQALDSYQSAVREGELNNVGTIDSKIGEIQNWVQKITSGQKVRSEVATQIANAAQSLVDYIGEGAKKKEKAFESQARVNGIDGAWQSFRKGFETNYDSTPQDDERYNELKQQFPDATEEEIREALGFNSVGKTSASTTTEVKKIASAIGHYESGGNYKAQGPVVQSGMYKGQRALGKYQIMPGNLPSWSKAALGRTVTPQEFLAKPELQDKIAEHKMAILHKQYGTVEDVASVWFSGRPVKKAGNAKDVIGTTVPKYVSNIRSIYNRLS